MNKIERMEFLTERMRDGKVFNSDFCKAKFTIKDGTIYGRRGVSIENLLCFNLFLPPTHIFTPDELVIMEHLPYPYLVRDFDGELWNHEYEPFKVDKYWEDDCVQENSRSLDLFENIFKSIKFENDEPVDRRDYL